jgi:glycosyltransferase involved in cell wall biosynthesis
MAEEQKLKKRICWVTPDYFQSVDSNIVPFLTDDYDIKWIIINTKNSKRKSDEAIRDTLLLKEIHLKYKQRDPRIVFQFIKLLMDIRKENYDLVYISFHGLPYFFPIFFTLIDSNKVIYGAHNVSTPKGASNEKLMRAYHHYAYKRFKKFQVFSKFQLDVITKMQPGKKHYYAPIALKDYGTSVVTPPKDVIRFLFFGYIRDYKRLDLLLKSFQYLYDSGTKNIELYIAGNCENWKLYEVLIAKDSPIITRIEIIPDKDIPDLVSACHYMVLPYKDGAQSGVLTLAYQYNKPVIVSDIESFKQFVVEGLTGFSFKNGSEEDLSNVLKNVVDEHQNNYQYLKDHIKVYVEEEFAIGKIIERYKNFLNDSIEK